LGFCTPLNRQSIHRQLTFFPLTEKMSVVDGLIDDLRGCKNPIVKGKKAEIVLLKTAEILRDLVKKLEG